MYRESEKKIYTTTNYEMFKDLEGNRSVKNARVLKTMDSICELGWLTSPILVNEKFEVIDGQGRLEALKRLEIPVEFIIEEGIGIKECQGLNHYQKNWSTMDYINSHVAAGNKNYTWLKSMLSKYKGIPNTVIFTVAVSGGKSSSMGAANHFKIIESGSMVVCDADKELADEALFYLSRFIDTASYFGGRKDKFYSAVMFLYLLNVVDKDRLVSVINNARYDGMVSSSTVEGYLQQFELLYNKGLMKARRIDMMHEYKIA